MNDYEQLIEMMFTDGTLDQSVRQEIEGMNDLQKRLHIVKILDKGLGLFTKIEGIMNLGKMDYIKNILMMLKSYVLIADVEKKKFGEVMTPLTLIKEMLSTLPEDVWSNPELKWLDPANGTGPYPIMVIYKLMIGLKDWEPDDEKRYKHILENMIYVGELQPKNMFLYMNAIDPMNEYNLNIYTGSFLEKEFDNHMKTVWNINKFKIVLGNPPYNDVVSDSGNAKDLFDKFILKSINISSKSLMITPSKWFTKKSLINLRDIMVTKLELINHFQDASKLFPNTEITGGVSYFILGDKVDKTIFDGNEVSLINQINEFGMILYDQVDYLKIKDLISRIRKFPKLSNFNAKGYFGIKTNQINNGQIVCYYSNQRGKKENMDLINGRYFSYVSNSDIKDTKGVMSKWKLMTSSAYGANPRGLGKLDIIEPNEICNESFVFFNFETKEECENFKKYLEIDIVRFLISIKKNKQDVTSDVFSFVPNLDFRNEYTKKDLIKLFNITEFELLIIEK